MGNYLSFLLIAHGWHTSISKDNTLEMELKDVLVDLSGCDVALTIYVNTACVS